MKADADAGRIAGSGVGVGSASIIWTSPSSSRTITSETGGLDPLPLDRLGGVLNLNLFIGASVTFFGVVKVRNVRSKSLSDVLATGSIEFVTCKDKMRMLAFDIVYHARKRQRTRSGELCGGRLEERLHNGCRFLRACFLRL